MKATLVKSLCWLVSAIGLATPASGELVEYTVVFSCDISCEDSSIWGLDDSDHPLVATVSFERSLVPPGTGRALFIYPGEFEIEVLIGSTFYKGFTGADTRWENGVPTDIQILGALEATLPNGILSSFEMGGRAPLLGGERRDWQARSEVGSIQGTYAVQVGNWEPTCATQPTKGGWPVGEENAALVVRNCGTVGPGHPCPEPRWASSYADIHTAVDCARDGDKIRLDKGDFGNEILVTYSLYKPIVITKDIDIYGRGPSQSIIFGHIDIQAKVTIRDVTLVNPRWRPTIRSLVDVLPPDGALQIQNCVIREGVGHSGGAIFVNAGASAMLTDSVLSNNKALQGHGGAVFNAGILKVVNSVFSDNFAPFDPDNEDIGNGGAIFNEGTLTLMDSLIAGNEAFHNGGGIYNRGVLYVISSAVTSNIAAGGGGIYNDKGSLFRWGRNVINDNSEQNCFGCER